MRSAKEKIKEAGRIVVKVGTSLITYNTGNLNLLRIEKLARVLSDLMNQDREIILVTSGAIGAGTARMGFKEKPETVKEKQALAAIGQCMLMHLYDKVFMEYGKTTAQILLTKDIITEDVKMENARNTLNTLLQYGVIPIVNENDTVATDEIEKCNVLGDNDTLSAVVAALVKADLLILLSDIDGLYTMDPKRYDHARLIKEVTEINEEIENGAEGTNGSFGTGGMKTKLEAAKICMNSDIPMVIINGENPENIYDVIEGKSIGTIFMHE